MCPRKSFIQFQLNVQVRGYCLGHASAMCTLRSTVGVLRIVWTARLSLSLLVLLISGHPATLFHWLFLPRSSLVWELGVKSRLGTLIVVVPPVCYQITCTGCLCLIMFYCALHENVFFFAAFICKTFYPFNCFCFSVTYLSYTLEHVHFYCTFIQVQKWQDTAFFFLYEVSKLYVHWKYIK